MPLTSLWNCGHSPFRGSNRTVVGCVAVDLEAKNHIADLIFPELINCRHGGRTPLRDAIACNMPLTVKP